MLKKRNYIPEDALKQKLKEALETLLSICPEGIYFVKDARCVSPLCYMTAKCMHEDTGEKELIEAIKLMLSVCPEPHRDDLWHPLYKDVLKLLDYADVVSDCESISSL